ncbi:MAG: pitrilysin family protein [bacterium]|nr:pitrilysin family protein [bacterium]
MKSHRAPISSLATRWGMVLLAGLVLTVPAVHASPQGARLFSDIQTVLLPNGLKVILRENHSAPVVSIQAWVRVGSAQESDGQAGMAHVLEHMLFKGTERRGVGEVARAVESRGGSFNAFTSYDHTVYHVDMASRDLPVGLEVLADVIQRSTLDQDELRKETQVILEEFKRARDRPARELYRRLLEKAFRVHPYRRPVIGYEETFKTFTRPALLAFYRRWYRPERTFLVIVGDIDVPSVTALVKRHFGSKEWRAGAPVSHALPPEPPQERFRAVVFRYPAAKARLAVGFHIPRAADPSVHALDALAFILGHGQSSRLFRRVKEDQQLVHEVSSYAMTPRDPGLFVSTAVLDPPNLERALRAVMTEMFRLAREGPAAEELEKAKVNLVSDFIYDQETMGGQARSLGFFESVMGDVKAVQTYVERVRALTPADLRRVARTYLKPSNCTVAVLLPDGAADEVDEARLGRLVRASMEAVEAEEGESKPQVGGVVKTVLGNGLTLLVKENHAVPTVAIRVALLGGLRYETPETNGVSRLMARLLTQGSANHTAAQMAEAVESIAGRMKGFSGRNSFGLEAKFLSEDWGRGLSLVAEALLTPTFDPEEVEKKKAETLAAIAQRRDDMFHETLLLFTRTLYDGHPYAMDPLGTEASVRALTRGDVLRFYRRGLAPRHLVLAVVGDVESEAVRGAVERLFGTLEDRRPSPPKLPRIESLRAAKKVSLERPKRQAHVILGFPGVRFDSPERYPLDVLEGVLAGQAGRLFVELRDKRSLAYSLTAFARPNLDPGFIAVYMGTSPEKVDEAVAGIRRELERLVEEPVGAEELKAAKRSIVGAYERRHQTNAAQAESLALMELYGIGYEAVETYPGKILEVTTEDVQRVARKYLTLERYVLALVRPPQAAP